MVDIPIFDSLAQGLGYASVPAPTTDAVPTESAEANQILGIPVQNPSPLQPMSLATKTELASELGAFLKSNIHEDNWLDPLGPHVAPEGR